MSNYSEMEHLEIAKQEYKNLKLGQEILVNNDTVSIGYVSGVIDNESTGEQSFIITDIPLPSKPSQAQKNAVSEVTVLYRGSTAPYGGDDWMNDWFMNDLPAAANVLNPKFTIQAAPPQLESASKTLNTAMKDYPYAMFNVYGHSLGSMNGQYALVNALDSDRIRGGYVYNGPNIYRFLTDKQKKTANTLQDRIFNYIDRKDLIGVVGNTSNNQTVGQLISIKSAFHSPLDQHMFAGYQFNHKGEIVTSSKKMAEKAAKIIEAQIKGELLALGLLRKKLKASGGKLSANEAIYLEDSEALLAVQSGGRVVKENMDELIKIYRDIMKALEENWEEGLQRVLKFVSRLSYEEVMAEFAKTGTTKEKCVDIPCAKLEEKIAKAKQQGDAFDQLSQEIVAGIEKLKVADQQLAMQIGGSVNAP